MKNHIIYLAKFVIETTTPIAIGSGEKGLITDRLIARDANGLPYIPGTSLAGVIRHELDPQDQDEKIKELFGFQPQTRSEGENTESGLGSRISFSAGFLVAPDNSRVHEGLEKLNFTEDFYSYFQKLPERDHVRITDKGAADVKGHGKYDEELVHKGTRFAFEIEVEGTAEDENLWQSIISLPYQPFFRIGAGTRKGFGALKVISCHTQMYDLKDKEQLLAYLAKSSSLNGDYSDWVSFEAPSKNNEKYCHYRISLQPESFFHFGAGFGDEDVDMKPKTELFFDWSSGKAEISEEHILIPATSVKGALSHRIAFHYNRLTGYHLSDIAEKAEGELPVFNIDAVVNQYFDRLMDDAIPLESTSEGWEQLEKNIVSTHLADILADDEWASFQRQLPNDEKNTSETSPLAVGEKNEAVKQLFGFAKEDKGKETGARGKVIFSDVYLKKNQSDKKVFSHVMIDRFTGGALDGALYQEKAVKTGAFNLDIFVEKPDFEAEVIKGAFEAALKDLITGQLQLGGNTTKGHGAFMGSYEIVKL